MKKRIPYPSKNGYPIREITEDNITSINKEEEEEGKNLQEKLKTVIGFYENNIAPITDRKSVV